MTDSIFLYQILPQYARLVYHIFRMKESSFSDLIQRAKEYLPKFYYTGFRGSFTTFGLPVVTHGNAAILKSYKIPERNGTYLIKQVVTDFGLGGIRQKINIHLRIDKGFTQDQLNAGVAG